MSNQSWMRRPPDCIVFAKEQDHETEIKLNEGPNETLRNGRTHAQSRCRKRLRTTDSHKNDLFGHGRASAIDLKYPNTNNGEENLAGSVTLGSFTFRMAEATANAPQPSTTCSGLSFQTVAGA